MQRPKDSLPVGMFQSMFGVSCCHQYPHSQPTIHFLKSPHPSLPLVCQPLTALLILGCISMAFPSIPKHLGIQTMRKRRATGYGEVVRFECQPTDSSSEVISCPTYWHIHCCKHQHRGVLDAMFLTRRWNPKFPPKLWNLSTKLHKDTYMNTSIYSHCFVC
jgi:hypothetical protein